MKVRRFIAPDVRQALQEVRDTLGPDAVILSNRKSDNGIEILATINIDSEAEVAATENTVTTTAAKLANVYQETKQEIVASVPAPQQSQPLPEPAIATVQQELNSLRGLLENELAGLAWADKKRRHSNEVVLFERLTQLGLTAKVSRSLLSHIAQDVTLDTAWQTALNTLTGSLNTIESDLVDAGGIYALVGTTGVGKTTTIAKLAARYALKHGADKVALLSMDNFRIGAHDQLKTYGKILGIPVRKVDGVEDLRAQLKRFKDKSLILIDTAGMGQNDKRLVEQQHILTTASPAIRSLLVVATNSQYRVMTGGLAAFGMTPLAGIVLTKLDECTSLGEILSVLIDKKLSVAYLTDGQEVPANLHCANARQLIHTAMLIAEQNTSDLDEERIASAYAEGG